MSRTRGRGAAAGNGCREPEQQHQHTHAERPKMADGLLPFFPVPPERSSSSRATGKPRTASSTRGGGLGLDVASWGLGDGTWGGVYLEGVSLVLCSHCITHAHAEFWSPAASRAHWPSAARCTRSLTGATPRPLWNAPGGTGRNWNEIGSVFRPPFFFRVGFEMCAGRFFCHRDCGFCLGEDGFYWRID